MGWGCLFLEKDGQTNIIKTDRKAFEEMSDQDFELFMYNLHRQAVKNLDSNRSFLTGLYNLNGFQFAASEEMIDYPDQPHALIVMDFSNFKAIHEFCGREAGDELLVYTANAFREEIGEHVVLGHFRADVFGMFTSFVEKSDLVDIVNRVAERISKYEIAYKVLPAFGICIAEHSGMSVSLMRDYATMALNTIKGKFYSRYAFFDDEMRNAMLMDKMIENQIVTALAEDQLQLYIQPKVDMKSKEIVGGEALVRWLHPNRGLVSPNEFIPIIEKNGLIIDVDIHIWRKVFKLLGDRIKQNKKVVPISINISRLHVLDKNFKNILVDLSKEFNVDPKLVPLELTESGFLDNAEAIYDSMKFLKNQGFSLSMDDFGTGYSTMTMLKNQPVDEIEASSSILKMRRARVLLNIL